MLREIGRGGMARVYLADDLKLSREVAIKFLRPDVAPAIGVDRFLREIRIESSLKHQHILPLYDSGELDGLPYYVMQYVEGESLRDRLRRETQLEITEAVRITRAVAEALEYAHGRGIVHRDIKPENIMLSGDQVLVADFGVARAITVAAADQLTETGMAVGTPAYMSPEQGGGAARVDGRSDLYSLACVLYEMLVGQPPFTGATAQAVIARHLCDRPPSIEVIRPTVAPTIVTAIDRALAKVPADRFGSVTEFCAALEAVTPVATAAATTGRPWYRWAAAAVAGGLAVWGGLALLGHRPARLDPNRVLVFPLHAAAGGGVGEDVATYIGHVLDGSEPLKWEEAGGLLSAADTGSRPLPAAQASDVSRRRRAAYYIDGSVLREPDSVTVVLRLHDVGGDSVVARAGRSGPAGASEARLGALAVAQLLPSLLAPGRKVDVGALADRRPAAIANFLQGERAYRRTRFAESLEHYRRAVDDDSLFALAAVKGAEAAAWLDKDDEANRLTEVALGAAALLPARYASFAQGWRHYLAGNADSAVADLRRAVTAAPEWSEGWMALGEVYYHLLPREGPLDSLAEAAFLTAQRLDPEFRPPAYHLAELALRRHDLVTAERLFDRLRQAEPDSTLLGALALALRCAKGQMRGPDWTGVAARDYADVLEAGKILSSVPGDPACAEAAFRAVLSASEAGDAHRFSALFGLHNLLAMTGRRDEVRRLLSSATGQRLHASLLYLYDAAAGAGFQREALETARAQSPVLDSLGSTTLWLLGVWEAGLSRADRAAAIQAKLAARARAGNQPRDRLFADIVGAHAALAAGDTALAVRRLQALVPAAPRPALAWTLWDGFGLERLTLASIQLESGDPAAALRTASVFDSPRPIAYLLYLPASLALRMRAAEAIGDRRRAAEFRSRLKEMGREDLLSTAGAAPPPMQEAP